MPTRRSGSSDRSPLALAGATIVLPRRAHETLRLAAGELGLDIYNMRPRLAEAGFAAIRAEHYEGGHWLGSFAVYYATRRGISSAGPSR